MPTLDQIIQGAIVSASKHCFQTELDPETIQVQQTRKEFEGDRTVVVFPLTRASKSSPEATAELLGQHLVVSHELISAYQVVKGFLNLTIIPSYWTSELEKAVQMKQFGFGDAHSLPKVMVEYSSPNTNKPLHLGHLRNNFLGYSVSRILEAAGHSVVKVQIINDRGIHICKSMVAWQLFGNGETPESAGIKGDKLVGKYYVRFDREYKQEIKALTAQGMNEDDAKNEARMMQYARDYLAKWEANDPDIVALWKTMNSWVYDGFAVTYKEMGVDFDQLYYESETYLLGKDQVIRGLEMGAFYKKEDGSVWADLTAEGLDEKLVLRKDGTSVYMTQDIGTAIKRYADYPGLDRQIYTVGNEQEYHFKVLFKLLKLLGVKDSERNRHLSYGMVELPEGKMKSREGTVVDADELLAEMADTAKEMATELGKVDGLSESEKAKLFKQVGYGAIKYFLLKVSPQKSMMFDPKASIDFIGNTGPFIQFNFVRAKSVLRKSEAALGTLESFSLDASVWDQTELRIIQHGLQWPNVLQQAASECDPSLIANHCYEFTKAYSRWYQDHPVMQVENKSLQIARTAICLFFIQQIENAMGLLGIEMPERM
ncbi:MAG: arginine--tRNA ligase [Crocinitomicaceae bacterium]|jgi:arginyl-tRNA synthetase|nr:arginine--tRNA ligase [Crocinitomicaceae bacterium]